jgi:hypothetical protein
MAYSPDFPEESVIATLDRLIDMRRQAFTYRPSRDDKA